MADSDSLDTPVYLDANALIEAVEAPQRRLFDILGRLSDKGLSLVTSELSLAEVLCKPCQDGADVLIQIYDEMLGDHGLVRTIPVDRETLRTGARLRASLGGKLPASIHIATAMIAGCSVIVSSDRRLRLPDDIRRIACKDAGVLETR